jgi:O-antigen/teichoic acid export membrane protein
MGIATIFSWEYLKTKWNHTGFQRYFANMSWMFAGRIFILFIAFFINAYMARYLGPNNYGLLNYTFSFVGLFAFIASLGLDSIVNREIIKNHAKKDEIIGTSFFLKATGSLVAIIIIFISARLTVDEPVLLGLISLYSLVYVFNAFGVIDTYFQSQALSKYPVIVMITTGVITTILKIAVIMSGSGIIWLVGVYTLESFTGAIGMMYFFIRRGNSFRKWVFNPKIAISILRDSWPLILSSIAVTIYMDIDQVMIKNMISNESLGIYAVAVKLSEVWYFIPGVIIASVFPAIVNAKLVSEGLYTGRIMKLYSLVFWLSFGIALFTTIFASLIIHMLFGEQYLGAVTALRIYTWAGVAVSLGFVLRQYLIVENFTKISAITTVVGAVINVILNIIFIPKYGINGAATVTVISYTLATFSVLLFKNTRSHAKVIFKSIIPKFNR